MEKNYGKYICACQPVPASSTQGWLSAVFEFAHSFVHLFFSWVIYELVVRNGIAVLMGIYVDEKWNLIDKIKEQILFQFGFCLASIGGYYVLTFIDGLFGKLGSSLAVSVTQTVIYGIFDAVYILILLFLLKRPTAVKTLPNKLFFATVRLLMTAGFFSMVHYFATTHILSSFFVILTLLAGLLLILKSVED